jgi:hypothetical protein
MKLRDILEAIIDHPKLSFKWIDDQRCTFEFNERIFGIYIDYQTLFEKYSVANVSFGVLKQKSRFFSDEEIDTKLTGDGKPKLIFSTVAHACLANKNLTGCDMIALAGADEKKEKRVILYDVLIWEIQTRFSEFKSRNIFYIKTPFGIATILSKFMLTPDEQKLVQDELKISKIEKL